MIESNLSIEQQKEQIEASFISRVFGWMTAALVVTGGVALWAASTPAVLQFIFSGKFTFYGLMLAELGLVLYISARIQRLTAETAGVLFLIYSVLNGLTFSAIFLAYTSSSIASTFFITAGTFGVMAFYGYTTKKDLTSWGNLLFMGLIGLVISSLVNLFFQSETFYWIASYIGVLIFVGLTAYDTQKIKKMAISEDADTYQKKAILGALTLYLDFVNMFLYLLRIFGDRK